MKRYSFLHFFVTVNIFWGIVQFLMIMAQGFFLINEYGYLKQFGRDESGSIFMSHLFLAVVFFIIFEVIAYFLHQLWLTGLEAEAQHQQLVTSAQSTPTKIPALTGKTGLKVTGYILTILGIGFLLLLAFMVITVIFNNPVPADYDYSCDFDCGTPPDELRWILFATMSYVATFIVFGFTIGASCLAIYRMKQVTEYPLPPESNMPPIVISDENPAVFRLLAFSGLFFGGMIIVFGTIIIIITIIGDISRSRRYLDSLGGYLFGYGVGGGIIWLAGFGLLGIGLIFYYVGDIRQYIRAKRDMITQ